MTAGPPTAYVTLMALIAALWVKPPLLGWIGFAIVAAVGAALIAAGFTLFPRSRTNIATIPDDRRRDGVLVLVDATCTPEQLSESIARHVRGRDGEVHVVAPDLPEPLSYVTSDEERDRADTDDPLQAVGDALTAVPPRELVIVTGSRSGWLEEELLEDARPLVATVEQITVAPGASGA